VAKFVTNDGHSHFESLQAQLRTRLTHFLHAVFSYNWSHSIDNVSRDGVFRPAAAEFAGQSDRGSSDFDVRHSAKAMWVLDPPLFRGWSLSGVLRARTGFPLDVANYFPSVLNALGGTQAPAYRPDVNPGVPVWIGDSNAPGGRKLNFAAFSNPVALRQGNLGRNAIGGFGMSQLDLAIAREFHAASSWTLQFRLEAFNALNHPNFADPTWVESGFPDGNFGQSHGMLNFGLNDGSRGGPTSGLNPAFQIGGPRMLQAGIRFRF